jgi:DNA-binding NtrC family response regulator
MDLVLLSGALPAEGIAEVVRRFQEAGEGISVILVPATEEMGTAAQALKGGAADFFTAPLDLPRLEIAVRNAVRIRTLERELRELRSYVSADGREARPPVESEHDIRTFETLKEEAIRDALHTTGGSAVEAARRLNIGRATLYRLAKKFRITI